MIPQGVIHGHLLTSQQMQRLRAAIRRGGIADPADGRRSESDPGFRRRRSHPLKRRCAGCATKARTGACASSAARIARTGADPRTVDGSARARIWGSAAGSC